MMVEMMKFAFVNYMTTLQKLIFSVLLLAIWTLFYEFVNRVLKVKASKFG